MKPDRYVGKMARFILTEKKGWRCSLLICSACLVVAIACGTDEVSEPARTAELSDSLDGAVLEYPGSVAFVPIDQGVAVVDGAHNGAVAIAMPDGQGGHRWHADEKSGRLDGVVAWRDGEAIHIAGHRCPAGTTPEPGGDDGDRCPTAPIVTITFMADSLQMGAPSPGIETGGVVTDLVGGNGSQLLAILSDGRPSTGSALVDISKQSIARFDDDQGPVGLMACPSGDWFVQVSTPSDGYVEGANTLTSDPNDSAGELTVQLLGAGAVHAVPLEGTGALSEVTGRISVVGCAQDGVVLQADGSTGDQAVPYLVRTDSDGRSAEVSALPAGPYGGPPQAAFFVDLTSTRILSKRIPIAEAKEDRGGPFSILESNGEWVQASKTLAEGETIVMNHERDGYVVSITDRGMFLRAFEV